MNPERFRFGFLFTLTHSDETYKLGNNNTRVLNTSHRLHQSFTMEIV
jgi:hypothetical protein